MYERYFGSEKNFEKDYEYGYGSKGNNDGKKEIDCSHLVNSMVRGAGYNVPYQTTEQLNASDYYDVIDPSEVKSGDILLWRGKYNHTGILDSISYSASPLRFSGTFFGAQSSSGPATAKFGDGAPYWPRPLKILRQKEKYKTGNIVKTEKLQSENRRSSSQLIFPVVNEKGEQYKNSDAIYKLLEKETSGFYLLSAHNFWHGGIHFTDASVPHHIKDQSLCCMMDGKVISYRLNKNYLTSNWLGNELQYSSSFCLIQHEYESPTNTEDGNNKGKKNKLTFYSLYMHLAPYSIYASAADDEKKTKQRNS